MQCPDGWKIMHNQCLAFSLVPCSQTPLLILCIVWWYYVLHMVGSSKYLQFYLKEYLSEMFPQFLEAERPCPSEMLLLYPVILLTCCQITSLVVECSSICFLVVICPLYSHGNKIWVYEICELLHCFLHCFYLKFSQSPNLFWNLCHIKVEEMLQWFLSPPVGPSARPPVLSAKYFQRFFINTVDITWCQKGCISLIDWLYLIIFIFKYKILKPATYPHLSKLSQLIIYIMNWIQSFF